MVGQKWNDKDIEYLKNNYYDGNKQDILLIINKSWAAIQMKARLIGLTRKIGNGMIVKCGYCGKELYRRPNEIKRNKTGFFCSNEHQMLAGYKNGTRDRYKITQKAHDAVIKKSQERFKQNPNKVISKRGYYEIYIPQIGFKKEHHIIWEQHNGKIPEGAIIHHINGNPLDNRIENLMMFPNNAAHMAYHYKNRKINDKGQFIT